MFFLKNCVYTPGFSEQDTIGGFELIAPFMLDAVTKAFASEERGADATDTWDLANDIMMCNLHFIIAALEMKRRHNNGTLVFSELAEDYKFDCIRKTMACKGFDVDPLMEFYGLANGGMDGIDFMDIEDGPNVWTIQ